ncbi:MAG: response regulator transcription factor, partial [Acidothermaceae bacterium]
RRDRVAHERQLAPFDALTARERDVLAELIHGRQVNEISRLLFVSEATVRTHVRAILLKLDVTSQLAAVAQATEAGWNRAAVEPRSWAN